jgi:hypothetical protein
LDRFGGTVLLGGKARSDLGQGDDLGSPEEGEDPRGKAVLSTGEPPGSSALFSGLGLQRPISGKWNRSVAGREGGTVRRELNVLALIKGDERYIFVYDDASRETLLDALRDHAANPGLSFSWFDAAVLTNKAREQARQGLQTLPTSRSRI